MSLNLIEGCNRAQCIHCNQKVVKGELAVRYQAYRNSGQSHLKCLIKEYRTQHTDLVFTVKLMEVLDNGI